jgi:hypothetical protein
MIPWWWSWLLTAVGAVGLWSAGSRRSWGWGVGIGAQLLWILYALATEQYGFIVSAAVYGMVYTRNLLTWRVESGE